MIALGLGMVIRRCGYSNIMMLILIRGLPGSGKSTFAKTLTGYDHFEADMYFIKADGTYKYDRNFIRKAHEWCQQRTYDSLSAGRDVVVSNTFTQLWTMKPYIDMAKTLGAKLLIKEMRNQYGNIHNVPEGVLASMAEQWEELPDTSEYF